MCFEAFTLLSFFTFLDLAKGGCINEFHWDGGGSYNYKHWKEDMLTDSEVITRISFIC